MNEYLENAKEELKRADHLIYVSLKYTRTVDVIKSIVERFINCFDFVIDGLLNKAKEKKKIDLIPLSPGRKCEVLKEIYASDQTLLDYIKFYLLLRKISLAEYTRAREYRRHVTMTSLVEGKFIELNIDIITEYYTRANMCVEYVQENLAK